ncbi:ATP adenylyltransferase [Prochlorococcus sp. MIT 1307]|uniref:ATP adenylyltransferase n=1 Tax=Prochlorococcus sp. MIT 1307 TaxID=3096219 RepID=UPI002A762F2D|nr:ATP adenylyltransferase [Prochlorococcus sp. MIT 1307]
MQNSLDKSNHIDYWSTALDRTKIAIKNKSLLPLETKIINVYHFEDFKFELRRLISKSPPHLNKEGPKMNPFLPSDNNLIIADIGHKHKLILNKYPVQLGHMLLITKSWEPQKGWLTLNDLQALEKVQNNTSGLWFFNSSPISGASQPHRHLQLLRRSQNEVVCPRNLWFENYINLNLESKDSISRSTLVLRINQNEFSSDNLYQKYLMCCKTMGLGNPIENKEPLKAYNLLICKNWFALIIRSREEIKGFNLNALGFAGYLLATDESDIEWLNTFGPEYLLKQVVESN